MNALPKTISPITSPKSIAERVRVIDWEQISRDLDAQGSAMIERLLFVEECETLAASIPAR